MKLLSFQVAGRGEKLGMKPGDGVGVEISNIGVLRNTVMEVSR